MWPWDPKLTRRGQHSTAPTSALPLAQMLRSLSRADITAGLHAGRGYRHEEGHAGSLLEEEI